MPLTPSQKSAAFRARRAAKIERYEAALRSIVETACPRLGEDPFMVLADILDIARQALNANNEVKS